MKYAVLSMDIEEWYHLDYLRENDCDRTYSLLDGIYSFLDIVDSYRIPGSFFILGELIQGISDTLRELDTLGHDLAIHGWDHSLPIKMDIRAFEEDVERSKKELEDVLGKRVCGYRAPCFSMDRKRLDALQKIGLKYDSSRILFREHPLYKEVNISGFTKVSNNIFRLNDFFEFQVSTLKLGGRQIPVSGGGYIRIFPWFVMKRLLNRYITCQDLYVFYIHPFELSSKKNPPFPTDTSQIDKLRFCIGRSSVAYKLHSLINILKDRQFCFTTFSSLRRKILNERET